MLTRLKFLPGQQKEFFSTIFSSQNLSRRELATKINVQTRTLSDWFNEKAAIPEDIAVYLSKLFKVKFPEPENILLSRWRSAKLAASKAGGKAFLEKYGSIGTPDGRKKGGIVSQQKRKEDPQKYRELGCNIPKDFPLLVKSEPLAETVGILLGDGGITNCQVMVALDRKVDRAYAKYVRKLLLNVFGELPARYESSKRGTIILCSSGVSLVARLAEIGIDQGDKIKRQVDFPRWIWDKIEYQRYCVRGLIDTDGGVYFHRHFSKGIKYRNFGLSFTSNSIPLLNSVSQVLANFDIKHTKLEGRIYIYSLNYVKKYFEIFGTSNIKNLNKLNYHLSNSTRLS